MARAHWASRFGFIMVTAGSAVGLGNIWRFPYITGKYGGSAFVCLYLLIVVITGLPIFLAELYLGQTSQKNAVDTFRLLSGKERTPWALVGWVGLVTGFLILGFYSVVGGWVLAYLWEGLRGSFIGLPTDQIQMYLNNLLASPGRLFFWHSIFMALTIAIVMGGISGGIERWNKIMMPGLLLLLLILLVRVSFLPGFDSAMRFLLTPDFSKITPEAALEAMGQSFFTLSLGMGAIITYGSYLRKDEPLTKIAFSVIALDTSVALLAGVVTLAAVFSFGLEPEAGPALMFKTLPTLFAQMSGGAWVSPVFFLLVAFAALTSSISLLEPIVTYTVDVHGTRRIPTVALMGTIAFGIGLLCALSFNWLSGMTFGKDNLFDFINKLTTNILLPLGGFFIAVFYGWVLGPKAMEETLRGLPFARVLSRGLLWTVRILSPIAVALVLINGVVHW